MIKQNVIQSDTSDKKNGGVLCVIFGVYEMVMELLAHPFKTLKKCGRVLIPLILGCGFRFVIVSRLLGLLLFLNAIHITVTTNFASYLFCSFCIALSVIAPGMSFSTLLIDC